MRASTRMPVRAVAYRRAKLIPKRMSASTTTIARYGQSVARLPLFGAIASSIAWRITIGIASERPE